MEFEPVALVGIEAARASRPCFFMVETRCLNIGPRAGVGWMGPRSVREIMLREWRDAM